MLVSGHLALSHYFSHCSGGKGQISESPPISRFYTWKIINLKCSWIQVNMALNFKHCKKACKRQEMQFNFACVAFSYRPFLFCFFYHCLCFYFTEDNFPFCLCKVNTAVYVRMQHSTCAQHTTHRLEAAHKASVNAHAQWAHGLTRMSGQTLATTFMWLLSPGA